MKLDADMHEAMTIICEIDGHDYNKWVEWVVCEAIRARVHSANVLAKRAERLEISGISKPFDSQMGGFDQ